MSSGAQFTVNHTWYTVHVRYGPHTKLLMQAITRYEIGLQLIDKALSAPERTAVEAEARLNAFPCIHPLYPSILKIYDVSRNPAFAMDCCGSLPSHDFCTETLMTQAERLGAKRTEVANRVLKLKNKLTLVSGGR